MHSIDLNKAACKTQQGTTSPTAARCSSITDVPYSGDHYKSSYPWQEEMIFGTQKKDCLLIVVLGVHILEDSNERSSSV